MRTKPGFRALGLALWGAIALTVVPAALNAQLRADGSISRPIRGGKALTAPAGTRALGLGSGLTLADPEALFYSPGMLTSARGASASVQWYPTHGNATSVASMSTLGSFTLGLGVQTLRLEEFGGDAISVGLARAYRGFQIGVVGKYLEDRIGKWSGGSFVADLGVAKRSGGHIVALSVQNLGPDIKYGGFVHPLTRRVALGWGMGPRPISAHWDAGYFAQIATWNKDKPILLAGGAEMTYVPIEGVSFSTRLGLRMPEYDYDRESDPFNGIGGAALAVTPLVAGLSFGIDRFTMDYAWEMAPDWNTPAHRVGIRIR